MIFGPRRVGPVLRKSRGFATLPRTDPRPTAVQIQIEKFEDIMQISCLDVICQ
jgi:hypothetical protein